ncbi:MAG: hypothetical protein ACI9HK_004447 [Pirellulaceae bacterium]|jgi:hypothetical protein
MRTIDKFHTTRSHKKDLGMHNSWFKATTMVVIVLGAALLARAQITSDPVADVQREDLELREGEPENSPNPILLNSISSDSISSDSHVTRPANVTAPTFRNSNKARAASSVKAGATASQTNRVQNPTISDGRIGRLRASNETPIFENAVSPNSPINQSRVSSGPETRPAQNPSGFNAPGFNAPGFNAPGFNSRGFNSRGFNSVTQPTQSYQQLGQPLNQPSGGQISQSYSPPINTPQLGAPQRRLPPHSLPLHDSPTPTQI